MADLDGAALAALCTGRFGVATAFFAAFFGAAARLGVLAGVTAFFFDGAGRVDFFAVTFLAATFFEATFFEATFFGTAFFTAAFFTAVFFGATFAAATFFGTALRAAGRGRAAAFVGALAAFLVAFAGLAALAALAATLAFFTLEPLPTAVLPLVALACWVVRVDFAISISRCGLAAGCYSL